MFRKQNVFPRGARPSQLSLTMSGLLAAFTIFLMAPWHTNAAEMLQVVNKSDLKIESITPVAEFFETRAVTDKGKKIGQTEVFKTGFVVIIANKHRSTATVKLELFLDYLNQGRTFSYIAYEVIGPGKTKKVFVMCDNIPIECERKTTGKESKSACKDLALATWDRHRKHLTLTRLK